MQDFMNKKIVLGISAGIAAYKTTYLVRELVRLGASVRVVMTQAAKEFVSPLTLQALGAIEVRVDLFDQEAERAMSHIELARWADFLLIAPATANCLAKLAHGLADDLLSTLYLVAEIPTIVCPAMNRAMWAHPATLANCAILRERKVLFIGPDEGAQACGEEGLGRMAEVESILNGLRLQPVQQLLSGKKIVITAGPTREQIDPVRFISNNSSGKMGYALAEAACIAGAEVTLISGPTNLKPPMGLTFLRADTAKAMHSAVMEYLENGMIYIGTAAIADYAIDKPALEKIKKQNHSQLTLHLVPNPDILSAVVASNKAGYVVGFAAETTDVIPNALQKLQAKKINMIIANQVGKNLGFDSDYNSATIITKDEQIDLSLTNKTALAGQIIAILAATLQNTAH